LLIGAATFAGLFALSRRRLTPPAEAGGPAPDDPSEREPVARV
jgi:hypothetical protein